MVILIITIIILALGFSAFIIFLIVKFFKWIFSPPKSIPVANANPYVNAIAGSDEFKQFIANRVEHWNKKIKEQKSSGVFDVTKKIYEEGEYEGVKYNIVSKPGGNMDNENSGADLLIKIILFSQF